MLFSLAPLRPYAAEVNKLGWCMVMFKASSLRASCAACFMLTLPTWHFMNFFRNLDLRVELTERQKIEGWGGLQQARD